MPSRATTHALATIERPPAPRPEPIVASEALRRIYRAAAEAAPRRSRILIRGERGVGKETLARWIHARSPRANGPFASLDCEGQGDVAATLFGRDDAPGLLEEAKGGTVFLDEVGALSMAEQTSLLGALVTQKTSRMNHDRKRRIDVRVIAATRVDLVRMISRGAFRQDLYDRLGEIDLPLAPLRERPEEIEPLARHFLARIGAAAPGGDAPMSRAAIERLRSFRWSSNATQLRRALERAFTLCGGAEIAPEHFDVEALRQEQAVSDSDGDWISAAGAERERIIESLRRTGKRR